ncbi:MAG: hypothetical protein JJE39_01685 [Vicinamibacteria bacterium]|nr:hypothetical protein [Vicinamibacteria bacterium]
MWFSERALVFVDTRSAAVAVFHETFGGPRLLRFAFERFGSQATQAALFKDVLADSAAAVSRLVRALRAPTTDATILLPLGAAFPSIVDLAGLLKARDADVDEADAVRFRVAALLPFPVAQAEVRTEASPSIGAGVVLAQAILKTVVLETEAVMATLGFKRPHITSALSAALRGLPPRPLLVDLIFGDSACAIAVRNQSGVVDAIHLRLLLEGEDRAQRSLDEARRATPGLREIRALGQDIESLRSRVQDAEVHPAFEGSTLEGADPQQFPFLAVFHARTSR